MSSSLDDLKWLQHELKQVDNDIYVVSMYYELMLRGNTVSCRYEIVNDTTDVLPRLQSQLHTLRDARNAIIADIKEINLET